MNYNVHLNAFTESPSALRVLPEGSTLAVIPSLTSANALFAIEVREKVEALVAKNGYEITEAEEADYLVFTLFGMGPPNEVSQGGVVLPVGNLLAYVPRRRVEYFRWLAVGVARAEAFHTEELRESNIPWVWIGQAASSGSSSDLREVVDYLLVPTFERFGERTERRISLTIDGDDPRVMQLRNRP